MENIYIFGISIILISVFHYLGFSAREEFFFFERKYARILFFVLLPVLIFLAYLLVVEYSLWEKLMKFLI